MENNAFDELTEYWDLTHCAHRHPVPMAAKRVLTFGIVNAHLSWQRLPFRLTSQPCRRWSSG